MLRKVERKIHGRANVLTIYEKIAFWRYRTNNFLTICTFQYSVNRPKNQFKAIRKESNMAKFTVKEIYDGDTFSVAGGWKWGSKSGEIVRPLGYDTPEKGESGHEQAKEKLTTLIQGKVVDIPKATSIDDYGRLLADVYYEGRNLADYFPEYKL